MSRLKFVKFTQFPSKKRFNSTFLLIFTKILKNHIICNDIKRKLFMRIILSTESVRISINRASLKNKKYTTPLNAITY